jgi:cytochrome c5
VTRGTTSLAGTALIFAVALISAIRAEPLPQASQQDAIERAERIMNGSCQGCHDVRRLQIQAKDAAGWTATIQTMVEKGATIAKDDVPLLVDYLVDRHGPIPDGPGKAIVLNICTMCHDLKRIKLGRRSEGEWEETLVTMLNEGAPLSEEQFPIVQAYLTRNFGVD